MLKLHLVTLCLRFIPCVVCKPVNLVTLYVRFISCYRMPMLHALCCLTVFFALLLYAYISYLATLFLYLLRSVRLHLHHFTINTGCPRKNVPDFRRAFLMLKYTNITQNTYVQIWTVTEIMAREVWNFDSCYTLIDYQIHMKTGRNMWFL